MGEEMKRALIFVILLMLMFGITGVTTAANAAAEPMLEKPVIQGKTIAAGNGHLLVVKADGSLWAWGSNNNGQLGDGTTTYRSLPVKIMENVVSVAARGHCSFAIKTDGSLWAWGYNEFGQIGDGTITTYTYHGNNERTVKKDNNKYKPVKIMDNVVYVAAGAFHSLAVKTDGSLWAWGNNQYGKLGDGTITTYRFDSKNNWIVDHDNDKLKPVKIMENVVAVEASYYCSYAIKEDNSLWAWGYSESGQLGNGQNGDQYSPVKIMEDVASVQAAITLHALAIKTDGSLWAWGRNDNGQLGDGTVTVFGKDGFVTEDNKKTTPIKITDDAVYASAGEYHSLAVKIDGSLWAWGENEFGQIGNGKITIRDENDWNTIIQNNNELRPLRIMENIAFVEAGELCSFAVKADGGLWAWGQHNLGDFIQLSDGTITDRRAPVKLMDGVKLPTPVTTIQPPLEIANFPDVPPSHWANDSIMQLTSQGVVSGYPDGSFKPGALVSRSEFAKMMYLALGIDKTNDYSGVIVEQPFFVDVPGDRWDYLYVKYVGRYMTGFMAKDGQVYFKGGEPAVREDMAVALVKALGLETAADDDVSVFARLQEIFSDAATISPNLRAYVLTAYEQQLISGYPDGAFGAQKSITRAETAALLVKVQKSEAMQKVTFR